MSRFSRRMRVAVCATALAVVATGALTACTGTSNKASGGGAKSAATGSAGTPTKAADAAATLAITPAQGATDISPSDPVTVAATGGKLSTVTLTDSAGATVAGTISADGASWAPAAQLGYGASYTLKATAANAQGVPVTQSQTFTTVKPSKFVTATFRTTFSAPMTNGATYGVGMVVDVHFSASIKDHKAAEAAVAVTTAPAVAGAWYWLSDTDAHWRPENYYATGTQVTFNANIYGKQLSPGLYGKADVATAFTVGAKHVSIADDTTHMVSVYFDDVLQRTMPTSMGRGGSTKVGNKTITFWTQPGTYTVIDKQLSTVMDSSSYGLPVNSPLGYKETIPYATRISTDGIFLHELDSTVSAQGHRDVSHGCLNLNKANAMWFYQNAQIGDVVQVVNTGGPPLQVWQNGDWTVPWATWTAGGAA